MRDIEFAAIDFETANKNPNSACAVGLAIVKGGKIVDTWSSRIRPPTTEFTFTHIHGITYSMVRHARDFKYALMEISRRTRTFGLNFVAHNASFDASVMAACIHDCKPNGILSRIFHELIGVSYSSMSLKRFLCTYRLAKDVLPKLDNYGLDALAKYFGIKLDHHDAKSDAIACAKIAIELIERSGINKDLLFYSEKIGYSIGLPKVQKKHEQPFEEIKKWRVYGTLADGERKTIVVDAESARIAKIIGEEYFASVHDVDKA